MLIDEINMSGNERKDSVLTTGEVAGLLGINQDTVRRWSDMGLLKSFRISQRGDRWYRYQDIASFMDEMNEQDFGKY